MVIYLFIYLLTQFSYIDKGYLHFFTTFTFISANDLKFRPRSYSSCVYLMMRFKGSNGKICKMTMSHFRTLLMAPTNVRS